MYKRQNKEKERHTSHLIVLNIIRVIMLAPYFMAIFLALWFCKDFKNDKYIIYKSYIKVINNLERLVDG